MTVSDQAAVFRALHHGRAADDPLVLPGPWDAGSARVYADAADIEDGYGLAPAELVARLLGTGAVGCNPEDSADGRLKDPYRHADWLAEVRAAAGDRLFVNARVDTFIRGVGDPAQAIVRARLHVAAGADCVYPIGAPREAMTAVREGAARLHG